MEKKIEISYQLTDRELMEFAIKLYLNNLKNHIEVMCSSVAVLLLLAVNVLLTRSPFSVVLIVMYPLFTFYFCFRHLKKAGIQREMKMVQFQGVLEVEGDENTVLPCSSYESVTVGRRLILLRKKASAKIEFFTPVPVRAFASEDEKMQFIQAFRSPGSEAKEIRIEEIKSEEIKTRETEDDWDYRFDCEIEKKDVLNIVSRLFQKERQVSPGRSGWFGLSCFIAVMWSLGFLVFYMIGSVPIWILFLIPVIWFVLFRVRDKAAGVMDLEKEYEKGRIRSDHTGHWEIRLGGRGILLFHAGARSFVKWEMYRELLESDILFCFYRDTGSEIILLPKTVFKNVEEQNTFVRYCTGKGMRWSRLDPVPVKPILTRKRMIIAVLIFVICLPLFYLQKQLLPSFFSILQMGREEDRDGAFVFDPADYPDYVPFDRQVEVLNLLGIPVPEEYVDECQKKIEEEEEYRAFVEGTPYVTILSMMGYGGYDETTKERVYTDTVYWFDFEGGDISCDYVDLLNGINVLGKGEFTVSGAEEDCSEVNWEEGSGAITVTFLYNGKPCSFEAEMDYDWIDGRIIDYFNLILKQDGNPKQIYSMGDDGQGALLFYNTKEWADDFMKKTGRELWAIGE